MKIYFLAMSFLFSTFIKAEQYQLGVMLGSLTGVSGKVNLTENTAIDLGLSYSLDHDYGLVLQSTYLKENVKKFNLKNAPDLNLYYGIGGRIREIDSGKDRNKLGVGVRSPLGLSMIIDEPRLVLFTEVGLSLDLIPSTDLGLDGEIGLRYRF